MSSKVSSFEEKVKLPPTETISRCYQPQGNRNRIIRILTVAVYVLCVSLAAIMLSLYYIFIWDPTIRPFITKGNNCEKIVIPEKIAIRLINSSEVTAEQFYRNILEQYRILNQLQIQRQQFLQKQHIQLQQLAATNRFQEIFATATIIQSNPNDRIRKPITPTNGTFLLDPHPIGTDMKPVAPPTTPTVLVDNIAAQSMQLPILDTAPAQVIKRKSHRKHNNHHRHNTRKNHKKTTPPSIANDLHEHYMETPLNPASPAIIQQDSYTSMPIPLILNSKEDILRPYHTRGERKSGTAQSRKHSETAATAIMDPSSPAYESVHQTYLNPLLTGELIFEK